MIDDEEDDEFDDDFYGESEYYSPLLFANPTNLKEIFKNLLHLNSSCFYNQEMNSFYFKPGQAQNFNQEALFFNDLEHKTHHYSYQFQSILSKEYDDVDIVELLPFNEPSFEADKDSIIHFVKLLDGNVEVLHRAIFCYPEYITELLNIPIKQEQCKRNLNELGGILQKTLESYPNRVHQIKTSLINHLNQSSFNKNALEEHLIDLYKNIFGIMGIQEFLEQLGYHQEKTLLGSALSMFTLSKNRLRCTYLSVDIFSMINDAIIEHHLSFPKAYALEETKQVYLIGVESHFPNHVEKIEQLIQVLSLYQEDALKYNHYELIINMILKVNLDFENATFQKIKNNKI
jgi:hypothetical protein